jgi:hypothetical protein
MIIIVSSFVVGLCLALGLLADIQFIDNYDLDPRIKAYHKIIFVIYLIITFIVQIYVFLIVDSLHKRFRDEEYPSSYNNVGYRG